MFTCKKYISSVRAEFLSTFPHLQGDLLKRKYKDLKLQWEEKIDILKTVEK